MGGITSSLDNSVAQGVSVIRDAQGNLTSIIRDSINGTVSVFQHTTDGLRMAYTDTEQNFFSTANNVVQNIANTFQIAEKGVIRDFRATEKDIVTLIDDMQDNVHESYRKSLHDVTQTIQWIISLGFLGWLLVVIIYGHDIFKIIQHIIDNGVKVSF